MLEKFKKYRLVSVSLLASFLLVIAGFIWAMFQLGKVSGPLILHFDDLRGIVAVGGAGFISFMGIFGLVMVILNGSIAFELEGKNKFFGKALAVFTLVLATLLFIAFAAILSVN